MRMKGNLPPPVSVVFSFRTPIVFPGDSLLSEPLVLEDFQRMNHTYSGFYCRWGTIGHNEVLFPSMSLGGSWLQMLFSLSPIISCLIEDNITRQQGPAHHSASMACSMERASLLKVGWRRREGCVSIRLLQRARACLIWTKKMDN